MKIYKFRDMVDRNYCFIMAKSLAEACELVSSLTSIPTEIIESKSPGELIKPIIILNNILPF